MRRFLAASGGCIGFVEILMLPCYWEMQLQFARRLTTVDSRWHWVADGGAVLLGNADC